MPVTKKSEISQDDKGICGFTHMLQMLIDEEKLTLGDFNNTYTTSTAFADEWLRTQIAHDSNLKEPAATALKQSLLFTGDFGEKFKVSFQELLKVKSWDWENRDGFALTPEAICDYVARKYGLDMMIQTYHPNKKIDELWTSRSSNLGQGIYGIKTDVGVGPNQDQIEHYVYIDRAGELMTWQTTGDAAMAKLEDEHFSEVVVRLYPKSR